MMQKNIYATLFPYLRKKEVPPQAENPAALNAQTDSALNPSSPRSGVLFTPGEAPPTDTGDLMEVPTEDGTLFVNPQKTGFTNPQEAQNYVARNGVAPIIGKVENIPNNSEADFALRTEDAFGRELSTSAVTSPQTAAMQAENDRREFGGNVGDQFVMPSDEVARMREDEPVAPVNSLSPKITSALPEFTPPARETGGEFTGLSTVSDLNFSRERSPYVINKSNNFQNSQAGLNYYRQMYESPQNEDRGWRGRLKELAENFLSGMALAARQGGNNPNWRQVLLGGGVMSGFGTFDRTLNERNRAAQTIPYWQSRVAEDEKTLENEQNRRYRDAQIKTLNERPETERQRIAARVELEQLRQRNRIETLRAQNANKEDDWDHFIRDGKVWKMYKNRDGSDGRPVIEPLIDPDTGNQMTPVEDQLYEYYDRNGQRVMVKGGAIVQGDVANANREQSVNNFNTAAMNRYQNDMFDWQNRVTAAGGEVSAIDRDLAGLMNKEAELNQTESQILERIRQNEGNLLAADQVKADRAALERIQNERRDTTAKIQTRKGELEAAKQKYTGLRRNPPQKPQESAVVTTNNNPTIQQQQQIIGNRTENEWVQYSLEFARKDAQNNGTTLTQEQEDQIVKNAKESYRRTKGK